MQYNQFCSNGINNSCGPYLPYNPQIIGEGDVTSVMTPNGTIQYVFTPIAQWWPYSCNPGANTHFTNPFLNAYTGAWFVRSISNAFQPSVHSQPYEMPSIIQRTRPGFNSESNIDISGPGFQLKFHNDNWTSTTDLHYFYPRLRQYDMATQPNQRGSAAIQVEMPVLEHSIYHCKVICDKPCHCRPKCQVEKVDITCDESASNMSIEETKQKHGQNCCQDIVKQVKVHKSSYGGKNSKKDHVCGCKQPLESCTDKSVTTYNDQSSGCTEEVGRETQTNYMKTNSCANATTIQRVQSVIHSKVPPEKCIPKTSVAKKPMKSKARNKRVCESDCSGSCSCYSESE